MTFYMSDYVADSIRRATALARRLNLIGYMSVTATTISVLLAASSIVLSSRMKIYGFPAWSRYDFQLMVTGMGACAVCALLLVAAHDQLNRRSRSLQSLLADILQDTTGADARTSMTDMETKYAIRTLASSSDLPLVPGRFGPAVYAAVNLIASFTALSLIA